MNTIKSIGQIIISAGLLYIIGLLFYAMILSHNSFNFGFLASGTAINKAIVWIGLFTAVFISTIIRGVRSLINPKSNYKNKMDRLRDIELIINVNFESVGLYKISFIKVFSEPIFYLFAGIVVLPMIQMESFIQPLSFVNILILIVIIIFVNFLLSIFHSFIHVNLILNGEKSIDYIINENGIEIEGIAKETKYNWRKIKDINESLNMFTINVNWFLEYYIPKRFIEPKDLEILREISNK